MSMSRLNLVHSLRCALFFEYNAGFFECPYSNTLFLGVSGILQRVISVSVLDTP